ncbi:Calcipressin [Dentipellis sp. KUC8613]|nr:Calcipressin [Dentipellis sp. KUC8613]
MPGISINTEPSSTRPASPQRTNTLVITSLPAPFFHPLVMQALRDHFEIFGAIYAWAPLRAFARVIVVFYDEEHAEEAKVHCDGLQVDATPETDEFVIRVYRGDPTPIESVPTQPREGPDPHYLYPPAIEKNFLISPPGSPPVGWEPIKEEPPNATPLADDLIAALRKLQLVERQIVGPQVLVEPEEGAGIGVYVEDCDAGPEFGDMDGESDWTYGDDNPSRMKWRPTPTALPPMCAAS